MRKDETKEKAPEEEKDDGIEEDVEEPEKEERKRAGEREEEEEEGEEEQRTGKRRRRTFETDVVNALKRMSIDLAEVYSPPRVATQGKKMGLRVGESMDLTTGWDFNKEEDRIKAEKRVDEQKPLVRIGSPPCVAFSQLQTLIPDSQRKAQQLAEGIRHMEFMAKLYNKQVEGGRVFLHENPANAKSWALPCIRRLMRDLGVYVVEADQCMFGLKTWGRHR